MPRCGNRRDLRCHVVNEEAEDAGLRGHVKKLREHRHPEMWMRPDRLPRIRRFVVNMVIVFHLDVWHRREEEDDRKNYHDDADERVRNPEPFAAGAYAGRILRIEERATGDWAEEQADAINGLREVDAGCGVLRRTEHSRVGICDGFEKGEPGGDHAYA